MSMIRKTLLTSAVVGVGLVSSAGAAFAGDDPGHHSSGHHSSDHHESTVNNSCSPVANSSVDNGGAKQFGGIVGSSGVINGSILCDAIKNNGNGNLSGNHLTVNLLTTPEDPTFELPGTGTEAPEEAQTFAAPSSVPAGTTSTPIQAS